MVCAIDLCDEGVVLDQTYEAVTPLGTMCTLEDTYEAVSHFGNTTNGLAPQLNDSYALMASGLAEGTEHTTWCDDMTGTSDPYSSETFTIYDVVEWRLTIQAPEGAESLRFKYVFLCEEYDDFISSSYNDKFYAILEAPSTNGGSPTIINYTECRDPSVYVDFEAPECDLPSGYCCYIAVNSAFSECCWYPNGSFYAPNPEDPPCPDGFATTDISGTGFECASSSMEDGPHMGSSTGWLQTAWPIEGGETFSITFHIHDTSDGVYDAEVILDAFEFLGYYEQGTTPIE
jgi:hypothetical protein